MLILLIIMMIIIAIKYTRLVSQIATVQRGELATGCTSLDGITLLSKARNKDIVGNRVPDSHVSSRSHRILYILYP